MNVQIKRMISCRYGFEMKLTQVAMEEQEERRV